MPIRTLASAPGRPDVVRDGLNTQEALLAFFDTYQALVPHPKRRQVLALAEALGLNGDEAVTASMVESLVSTTARNFERATGLDRETFEPVSADDIDLDGLLSDDLMLDDNGSSDEDDEDLYADDADDDETDEDFVSDEDDPDLVPMSLTDNIGEDPVDTQLPDIDDLTNDLGDEHTGPGQDGQDDDFSVDPADITLTPADLTQLDALLHEDASLADIGMDSDMAIDGETGDRPGPDDLSLAIDGEPEALSDPAPFAADDGSPDVADPQDVQNP